ncbi:PAS domain-containing protein [Aliidiomarina quisquiliarum]|uniref:PAS domain-containing protein n=1 Tax=Aliidiomarina quisquiliarum TaxID=2938947 RepID=UPI00208FDDA5|nr:PAS domain-containing protein [Aliidiomarina quisquiliarum]
MQHSDKEKLFWLEAIISGAQLGTWIWNVQTDETRMKHKDGHWMWVRDSAKVVTYTDAGQPEWIAATHIDITEEKNAQQNIARLSKISQTMPGMIYEYRLCANGQSSFPFCSDGVTGIYGLTPEQVADDASVVFDLIHPNDLDSLKSSIIDSAETFDEWFVEYRIVVNGEEKWVTEHSIPERNSDGSTSWFGQLIDTTEEKKQAQA